MCSYSGRFRRRHCKEKARRQACRACRVERLRIGLSHPLRRMTRTPRRTRRCSKHSSRKNPRSTPSPSRMPCRGLFRCMLLRSNCPFRSLCSRSNRRIGPRRRSAALRNTRFLSAGSSSCRRRRCTRLSRTSNRGRLAGSRTRSDTRGPDLRRLRRRLRRCPFRTARGCSCRPCRRGSR